MEATLGIIALFSIISSAAFYWKTVPRSTAPWHAAIRPLAIMILTIGTSLIMFIILAFMATALSTLA